MEPVSLPLDVPPDRAFALLEDPRSLRALVPGARRVRRFDPNWPETGSAVHHTVGVPPLVLRDRTVVLACEPGERLVLRAGVHVLGTLTIEFRFHPRGSGALLTVTERPTGGPISLPGVRGLVTAATVLRNHELVRRYARLVARREALAARAAYNRPARPGHHGLHA